MFGKYDGTCIATHMQAQRAAQMKNAQQLELRQDNLGIAEVALEQHLSLERQLNLGGGGIARRVVVGIRAAAVACKSASGRCA